MIIDKYIQPDCLDEAYHLLFDSPKARILGGGLFLRLQKIHIPLLIDCSKIISSDIQVDEVITIGAMTTLRDLERDERLPLGLRQAVRQISGIGVRNVATIGGSICGRYPFSDINTALVAMNAQLNFYKKGTIAMRDFNATGLQENDILVDIIIKPPKFSRTAYYKKVYTDFSVVNISVADHTIAVGSRPKRPVFIDHVDYSLSSQEILKDVVFEDDFKASGAYRREICEARLTDIIQEMGGHHDH